MYRKQVLTLIVHPTKDQTTYMHKCIVNILQMQTPALHPTDTVTTIHGPMKILATIYKNSKHMKVAKQTAENNPNSTNICQMICITQAHNTAGMTDTLEIFTTRSWIRRDKNKYDSSGIYLSRYF